MADDFIFRRGIFGNCRLPPIGSFVGARRPLEINELLKISKPHPRALTPSRYNCSMRNVFGELSVALDNDVEAVWLKLKDVLRFLSRFCVVDHVMSRLGVTLPNVDTVWVKLKDV
jgi:hypothetical protein